MVGRFDPKVFCQLLTFCKQLTKTFGSKRSAVKYLSTVVYCSTSEILLSLSTQLWASTASSWNMLIHSTLAGCPVSGQTRSECASPSACHSSCANANTVIICLTVCVVNGCECPSGTFLNDDTSACVHPVGCSKLCESTKLAITIYHSTLMNDCGY